MERGAAEFNSLLGAHDMKNVEISSVNNGHLHLVHLFLSKKKKNFRKLKTFCACFVKNVLNVEAIKGHLRRLMGDVEHFRKSIKNENAWDRLLSLLSTPYVVPILQAADPNPTVSEVAPPPPPTVQVAKMTRMSVLADALNAITMAERKGKRQVMLRPASKVIIKFLTVMMKHGYIGEFEMIDDHRSNKIVVNLTGRLNKCGVVSPRFDVPIREMERWTTNLLPSRQFGYVVLTTSGGIMDHEEARKKHLGGKILGFFC